MSGEDSDVSERDPAPSLSPVSSLFHSHLSNPLSFLSPSEPTYSYCTTALRALHNLSLRLHPTTHALSHLYTEGFDQEQIWQQLELWNEDTCNRLSDEIEQLLTTDINIFPPSELDNVTANGNVAASGSSDEDKGALESETGSEGEVIKSDHVADTDTDTERFLAPDLMEKFLAREEKRFYQEDRSAGSSAGEDLSDLSEGEQAVAAGMKYEDYFLENENGNGAVEKSGYTQLKEKMQTRIEQLEEDNVRQKDWRLSGEVRSKSRPENSLLEEYMEHPSHAPAPLVTHETTEALEQMIRQRVRDELWDDPVRREKPQEKSYNPRSRFPRPDTEQLEGGQRKGLAEVYEEEYQRRADPGFSAQRGEEREIEDEIKRMRKELFSKLDALSNFRYTPKPYKHEPIVITNVPAVSMEEVLPSVTSEAMRMAPEEVEPPARHAPVSEIERTRDDKKRSRRRKKRAQSRSMILRAQKLVNRSNPGLGNRYSKRKLMEALRDAGRMQGQRDKLLGDEKKGNGSKRLRSSKAFFTELENRSKSVGKGSRSDERERRNKEVMKLLNFKFS